MSAYTSLAAAYDGLTTDVDYAAILDFLEAILHQAGKQPAFLLLQVAATFFDFPFVFGTGFMDFFFCFEEHFAFFALAALNGFVDDTRCLVLGALDLSFRDLFAEEHADEEE